MQRPTIDLVDGDLGATVRIIGRTWQDGLKEMNKKTRIHIRGVENLPELVVEDVTLPEPKEKGEDPENDKAYARYNRLYGKKSCEVAQTALEHVAEIAPELKVQLTNLKLRFSRTAGCGCGCSPGVVASDIIRLNGHNVDVYITLVEPTEPKMR